MDFVKFSRRLRRATISIVSLLALNSVYLEGRAQDDSASEARDNSAATELDRFIEEVRDFSARFVETVYDADGEIEDSSVGEFLLLRPNRFVWRYESPFALEVIGDGETLWTYDIDLEQIERRPLEDLASTPAMLLSGEAGIGERYSIRELMPDELSGASPEGTRWLALSSAGDAGDFAEARIAFRNGLPMAIELIDGLGQLTRVEFLDVAVNRGIDPDEFAFEPPAGVDVVGDE